MGAQYVVEGVDHSDLVGAVLGLHLVEPASSIEPRGRVGNELRVAPLARCLDLLKAGQDLLEQGVVRVELRERLDGVVARTLPGVGLVEALEPGQQLVGCTALRLASWRNAGLAGFVFALLADRRSARTFLLVVVFWKVVFCVYRFGTIDLYRFGTTPVLIRYMYRFGTRVY